MRERGQPRWRRRWLVVGLLAVTVVATSAAVSVWQMYGSTTSASHAESTTLGTAMEAKFEFLSTHGNSSCSQAFIQSISSMPDGMMLQGSCCTAMNRATYARQLAGLRTYSAIPQVPPDPYDIPASLAKQLLTYDSTIKPSATEQATLDAAVAASNEHGYCCCRCWRWSVYEGLSKYLVREHGFSAMQITEVLNNSDGCGG